MRPENHLPHLYNIIVKYLYKIFGVDPSVQVYRVCVCVCNIMSRCNGHNETWCQNKFWKSTNTTTIKVMIIIIIIIICRPFYVRPVRRGWSLAGLIRDCGCGHGGGRGERGEGRCVMFPVQFLMERRRRLLPACGVHIVVASFPAAFVPLVRTSAAGYFFFVVRPFNDFLYDCTCSFHPNVRRSLTRSENKKQI